jgi:hypothetical protein
MICARLTLIVFCLLRLTSESKIDNPEYLPYNVLVPIRAPITALRIGGVVSAEARTVRGQGLKGPRPGAGLRSLPDGPVGPRLEARRSRHAQIGEFIADMRRRLWLPRIRVYRYRINGL